MDDGSSSLEMSLDMLENASKQGITDVVNTIHYQHPKLPGVDISLDNIREKVDVIQSALNKNGISIKIHYGAEVFFLPNLQPLAITDLPFLYPGIIPPPIAIMGRCIMPPPILP